MPDLGLLDDYTYVQESEAVIQRLKVNPVLDENVAPVLVTIYEPIDTEIYSCILLDLGSIITDYFMPDPQAPLKHIITRINIPLIGDTVTRRICYAFMDRSQYIEWTRRLHDTKNTAFKTLLEGLENGCKEMELFIVKCTEQSTLRYIEDIMHVHREIPQCQEFFIFGDMNVTRVHLAKAIIARKFPSNKISWIDSVHPQPDSGDMDASHTIRPKRFFETERMVSKSENFGRERIFYDEFHNVVPKEEVGKITLKTEDHQKPYEETVKRVEVKIRSQRATKTVKPEGVKVNDSVRVINTMKDLWSIKENAGTGVFPCEWFHILHNCHNGSSQNCGFLHEEVKFTPRGLEEFRRWLARTPCSYGFTYIKWRSGEGCTKGHSCPDGRGCQRHKEGRCLFDEVRFQGKGHV